MTETLILLLRLAGLGLFVLAFLHIPIGRELKWKEEGARLSPANEQIFHVHTFFVCLCVVLMGLPCLIAPQIFLEKTPAGAWIAGSFAAFWTIRLYCQFFVYRKDLWKGKSKETVVHRIFSMIWLALAALFWACLAFQLGA